MGGREVVVHEREAEERIVDGVGELVVEVGEEVIDVVG